VENRTEVTKGFHKVDLFTEDSDMLENVTISNDNLDNVTM